MTGPEEHEPIYTEPDSDEEHPALVREFDEGVEIRARNPGIIMRAVYDEGEQVSSEFGPLEEGATTWAEGYMASKRRYQDDG